jgi:hypothetical protein
MPKPLPERIDWRADSILAAITDIFNWLGEIDYILTREDGLAEHLHKFGADIETWIQEQKEDA